MSTSYLANDWLACRCLEISIWVAILFSDQKTSIYLEYTLYVIDCLCYKRLELVMDKTQQDTDRTNSEAIRNLWPLLK